MKIPMHYQTSEYDCGPTTLLNALIFLFERKDIGANGGFADAERRNFWNRLDGDRDGTKAAWLKIQWVI